MHCLRGGANVLVNGILLEIVKNWFRYDSVPVYIMTMCLFIGFLNIRICGKRISKLIVKIAPLMLGVYLIHAHANVSPWSWEVLNLPAKMGSVMFPVIQIISTLGIFVICAVIDLLRVSTVGKVEYAYVVNKICIHIQNKIDGLTQQLLKETSKK